MKQTHMIRDKASGLYFRKELEASRPLPSVPRNEADLFSHEDALAWGSDHYNDLNKCEVLEATATEYMAFIGRMGGRKTSLKKQRSSRLNGRMRKGRKHATRKTA